MTDPHRVPSKTKPLWFTLCLNGAKYRAKFDYWDQKVYFDQLRHWQKLTLIESC